MQLNKIGKDTKINKYEIVHNTFSTDHESVHFFRDRVSNLKIIIAVHSTSLGPSIGGCRFIEYQNEEEAYIDSLKLSKAMTYKTAISDLPLGGGKMVIIKNNTEHLSREKIFKKAARCVNILSGDYITGLDSGTTLDDIRIMSKFTSHLVGCRDTKFPASSFASYSVLNGIKTATEFLYGFEKIRDIRVAIQGLGKTGYFLCKYLSELGAKLYITDCNTELVKKVTNDFDATVVDNDAIYDLEVDVFAPCALGGIINNKTIQRLRCKIICGTANDQLADANLAKVLQDKDILYVPDYVANAGTVISAYYEKKLTENFASEAFKHIDKIRITFKEIFIEARNNNIPTDQIADRMANLKLFKLNSSN